MICSDAGSFTRKLQGVFIDKRATTADNRDMIAVVKIRAHGYLRRDHPFRLLEDFLKAELLRFANVTKNRVRIKLHDLIYSVAQSFGWDRRPVRTVTANLLEIVHHRDVTPRLLRVHRCRLTRWTGADYDNVVVILTFHNRSSPLSIALIVRGRIFLASEPTSSHF